jgi:hypothetical protein
MFKSIRMRLVGHVAHMEEMTNASVWLGSLKGRDHLQYLCVGGKRIILK